MKQEDENHQPESSLKVYRLFGIRMGSSYPFMHRLIEDTAVPDIVFNRINDPLFLFDWKGNAPIYEEYDDEKPGEECPLLLIYRHKDYLILRFSEMDFYIGSKSINAHLRNRSGDYLLEIWLFGRVLSLWLKLVEFPASMLHQ